MSHEIAPEIRPQRPRRRLQLWHLSVAVLVSALFFGVFKGMVDPNPTMSSWSMGIYGGLALCCVVLTFVGGVKWGHWISFGIIARSTHQEGLASHLTCLLGAIVLFVSVLGSLAAAALVLFASIALPQLLLRM